MNYLIKNSINNIFIDPNAINLCDQSYFVKFFAQDFSLNTKKALRSDFRHFLVWNVGINKVPFSFKGFAEIDVSSYKQKCEQLGHAVSTINRRITHLRMLCTFAIEQKRMTENVAKKVKLLRIQPLAPKSLERADVHKLIRETQTRGKLRDKLIMMMFISTGMRVSELAALKIGDIDISDRKGHLTVNHGKWGKTREVPLNKDVRPLLAEYIANRTQSENVFLGQRGKTPLTPIAFNKIVEYYAKKAGIRVHPHQLRHTFSYQFLAQTQNDLVALASILGHKSLTTTQRYCQNRLSDLQEKVEGMVL